MKKMTAILLCAMLGVSLTACGGGSTADTAETKETTESTVTETPETETQEEVTEEPEESTEAATTAEETETETEEEEGGMPDLVGMSAADAEQKLIDLGCKLITSVDGDGDTIMAGLEEWEVTAQNVDPGTELDDPYMDIELTCQRYDGETVAKNPYDVAYEIGNGQADNYYYMIDFDEQVIVGFSEGSTLYTYATYEGNFEDGADVYFHYDDGDATWVFKYTEEGSDERMTLTDDIGDTFMHKVDADETLAKFDAIEGKSPSTVEGVE